MRKLIILLALAGLPVAGFAPKGIAQAAILECTPIVVFDPMLYAFEKIESNFNTTVVNSLGYGGILQIGQEMIDEVNRICKLRGIKKRFELSDRLNKTLSEEMWYIVQNHHNPAYGLKKACKVWNPTASHRYYDKIRAEYIKKRLETLK
jgi:hypothetical protein